MSKVKQLPIAYIHAKPDPEHQCEFELYSRTERKMVECGLPTVGVVGKNHLCAEHFGYVAAMKGYTVREARE